MSGRRALLACLVAVLATTAACTGIPTSGPVQPGEAIGIDPADQVIRVIARPPQPGMTPVEIVTGFLEASASFDNDHAAARAYLAPDAAATWDPNVGATVYDGVPTLVPSGPAGVTMTATQVGSISADGSYAVATAGRVIKQSWTLARFDGQWRITTPPPGLLLGRSDVDRAYRTYNLFYLDPTFSTLVPDPRLVPVDGPGLATSLVQLLAEGPSTWLAPGVRTGFPDGTGLSVNAVPITDATARVDLDPTVRLADESTRAAMSAQLAWTLRQVPGVRYVDLNAGGQALPVEQVPDPQPVDAWQSYDPNAMPTTAAAYAVSAGRVVTVADGQLASVLGGAGSGMPVLDGIAVSFDQQVVAGLDARGSLWRAALSSGAPLVPVGAGTGLSRPSFGRGDDVWAVGANGNVIIARADSTIDNVPVDGLSKGSVVESIAVSRDGARAALIVRRGPRTTVMLAVIVLREGTARLQSPRRVENRLTAASDVAWGQDDRLIVIGAEGAQDAQAYEIDLAHATLRGLQSPPDARRVAAAPGLPTVVACGDGYLYTSSGGPWRQDVRASSPSYPGS